MQAGPRQRFGPDRGGRAIELTARCGLPKQGALSEDHLLMR